MAGRSVAEDRKDFDRDGMGGFQVTRETAIAQLKEAAKRDTEAAHSIADDVLCDLLKSLGYEDVVEAWREVDKWYA